MWEWYRSGEERGKGGMGNGVSERVPTISNDLARYA